MPPYFFHVQDGAERRDREGADLANPREARSHAVIALGEMLQDLDGEFWCNSHEWVMTVVDEAGERICVLRVKGQA